MGIVDTNETLEIYGCYGLHVSTKCPKQYQFYIKKEILECEDFLLRIKVASCAHDISRHSCTFGFAHQPCQSKVRYFGFEFRSEQYVATFDVAVNETWTTPCMEILQAYKFTTHQVNIFWHLRVTNFGTLVLAILPNMTTLTRTIKANQFKVASRHFVNP